jgi:hypothetical protein
MIKGKKFGPPPKSGPNPQGLNIGYNTVKTVKLEKINDKIKKKQGKSILKKMNTKPRAKRKTFYPPSKGRKERLEEFLPIKIEDYGTGGLVKTGKPKLAKKGWK